MSRAIQETSSSPSPTPLLSPVEPPGNGLVVVVLAGGRSLRMGQDKRELLLAGQSMIARCLELVMGLGYPVMLADGQADQEDRTGQRAGQDQDKERPLLVRSSEQVKGGGRPPVESCPDGPGRGPAAGLLGAADRRPGHPLLAVACDLPFLSAALLRRLIARAERCGSDLVLPETHDGLHPLVAYYSTKAIDHLRLQVVQGRFSLQRLVGPSSPALRSVHREGRAPLVVDRVSALDLGFSEEGLAQALLNCNTPEDWQRAKRLLEATLPP